MFATSASGLALQKATQQAEKFDEVSVILAQSSTLKDMTNIFKSPMAEALLGRKFLKQEHAQNMNFVHSIVRLQSSSGTSVFCQLKGSNFVCDDATKSVILRGFNKLETRAMGTMKKALTRQEINEKASAAQAFFEQNGSYDLLSNNCNTTAEKFVQSLTGRSIGEDVTDPIAFYVLENMQAGIRKLMNQPMVRQLINIHQNPVEAEQPRRLRKERTALSSHNKGAQMRQQKAQMMYQQANALPIGSAMGTQNSNTNLFLEAADLVVAGACFAVELLSVTL